MALRSNKGTPRKEAKIDGAALNLLLVIIAVTIFLLAILTAFFAITIIGQSDDGPGGELPTPGGDKRPYYVEGITVSLPDVSTAKHGISEDFLSSEKAILVDVTANEIIASRQGSQMIYPASMTKVMTLIVVVENLPSRSSLDEVLTISHETGSHSGYGFAQGEKLTVKDLLYASILQSDGVACLTLADYIAGSEANFVKMMNEKAAEMGIGDTTLFQNCSGLHHQYHYSTCRDIATIVAYAMQNDLCASILTALKYTPSDNFRPGEGCTFWNTLLHNRLSDGNTQPKNAEIIGGKAGLTEKDTSGYCVVTYAKGDDGHYYISVTSKAGSWDANIDDILKIYNEYVK